MPIQYTPPNQAHPDRPLAEPTPRTPWYPPTLINLNSPCHTDGKLTQTGERKCTPYEFFCAANGHAGGSVGSAS